jgi:hypothetical protein
MIPQLASQPNIADCAQIAALHLTEDQFGELLACSFQAASGSSLAEAHLLSCEQCAAELAALRESLSLFRQASTALADSELRHLPQVTLPARPTLFPAMQSTYWVAAAAVVLAAFLPMQMLHRRALQPAPAFSVAVADSPVESDEALLEDVNREASASVPDPMQALVDPTSSVDASVSTSAQRKD